jgi:niacin transporter
VLLCGIICGLPYGIVCGIATPLISHLFTGMPPSFILPPMVFELASYGAAAALFMRFVKTRNLIADVYIALIGAMLLGRVIFGLANALIFTSGGYTMQIWVTAAFVTALPGIIAQIILIPVIVVALQKANLTDL